MSPAAPSWLVTIDLGGEVLGAVGGAPPSWVGARLATDVDAPPEVARAASAIVDDARRTGALCQASVESPALGARIEIVALPAIALRRAKVSIRPLLARALAPLQLQAHARDVAIDLTVEPGVPEHVAVDAQKLAWAIATIVGNAARYARSGTRQMPGGSIAVRARRDDVDHGTPKRAELVLEVEDDGPGIPADIVARLFDRGPGLEGAGMALGVVKDVLDAHGGSLAVRSSTDDADHGTTVIARLPLD